MSGPFDEGVPDNILVNHDFPGLAVPSLYEEQSGRPDPKKEVLRVQFVWLFRGIAGILQDRWFMITRHREEVVFWPDVVGARWIVKNGGKDGIDVETTMFRVQGTPEENPSIYGIDNRP